MLKLALARMWLRMSAIRPAYFVARLYDQPCPLGRIPITSLQSAGIGISSTYHASELGEKFVYTTGILVLLLTLELHAILTRYFQLP
jgi:hypothetical protein